MYMNTKFFSDALLESTFAMITILSLPIRISSLRFEYAGDNFACVSYDTHDIVLEQLSSRGSFSDGKMRLVSFSSYDDRES